MARQANSNHVDGDVKQDYGLITLWELVTWTCVCASSLASSFVWKLDGEASESCHAVAVAIVICFVSDDCFSFALFCLFCSFTCLLVFLLEIRCVYVFIQVFQLFKKLLS